MHSLSPEKTRDCLEHVYYEAKGLHDAYVVTQLSGAFARANDAARNGLAPILHNAGVELRALHARNLIEFLQCRRHKEANDLNARHYLPTFEVPAEKRQQFNALHAQASAQVSHLTTSRVTDAQQHAGAGSKSWRNDHVAALVSEVGRFIDALAESEWLPQGSKWHGPFTDLRPALANLASQLA
jgi:hypothetical protein